MTTARVDSVRFRFPGTTRFARAALALAIPMTVAGGLAGAAAGCGDRFEEPLTLGGAVVPAETLERGALAYKKYCVGCHGDDGGGRGGAAVGMTPAPRDFRTGQFKFKSVRKKGDLPTDDDLLRTVRQGLPGTHMNGFEGIADDEARAVVQFVKTFSERWRTETAGEPIAVPPDPWTAGPSAATGGQRMAAIARGRAVYHGVAACWECHPSYVPRQEVVALAGGPDAAAGAGTVAPRDPVELRDDLAAPRVVETAWGPETAPDFREHRFRVGRDPEAIYRVVAAGVGGTPMPAWHDRLSNEDLWAVVHYVREIQRVQRAL